MRTGQAEQARLNLRWDVRQRLEFIEDRLFWTGRINRGDLTSHFGISGVQATNDLSRYAKLAPNNMIYDTVEKAYLADEGFKPHLFEPRADLFLHRIAVADTEISGKALNAEILPSLQRRIDPFILRRVVFAAQTESALEIEYQSMTRPEPTWRWIAPHAFVSDGLRWHVRAFCFADHRFKDFLVARILKTGKERQGIATKEDDVEWNRYVTVGLMPHPGLSARQQQVISSDFHMEGGFAEVEVRQALLLYFLLRLNLINEDVRPEVQQIVLRNREEVLSFLTAQESSVSAYAVSKG